MVAKECSLKDNVVMSDSINHNLNKLDKNAFSESYEIKSNEIQLN